MRYLPLVPVTLQGRSDSAEVLALVDSGAEENVFQQDIADELGIDIASGREVILYGYDGSEEKAYRVMVDMQLGRHSWRAPVIFSATVSGRGLLGGAGFFAFFTVTLRYGDRVLDVRRVRT